MEQKIYSALAKFAELSQPIGKDADNPFFKSKYAPLDSIQVTIKPWLKESGLIVTHGCLNGSVHTKVVCVADGSFEESFFGSELPNDAQKVGAYMSYGKRYNLAAILDLIIQDEVDHDDDGNKASGKVVEQPKKPIAAVAPKPAAGAKWFNHTKFKSTEEADEWKQLVKDMTANKFPSAEDYIMDIKARGFKIYGPVEDEIRSLFASVQVPF